MKVGVIVPVFMDKQGNWKSIIAKMLNSLVNLSSVNDLEFLFNLQHDNQTDQADECIRMTIRMISNTISEVNPSWSMKSNIRPYYDSPISMVVIRNDCMMLDPECPIYLSIDDDFKFNPGAGDCYNEIIQFFQDNPKLGMVMSAGFLGGYNYKHKLKYAVNKHWMTCRGQFFRNLHKANSPVYSDEALQYCKAGYEDMVIAMEELAEGYELATHFNNPTTSKATKMESTDTKSSNSRYEVDTIHDVSATFSAMESYLKARYNIDAVLRSMSDFQPVLSKINEITK